MNLVFTKSNGNQGASGSLIYIGCIHTRKVARSLNLNHSNFEGLKTVLIFSDDVKKLRVLHASADTHF